MSHNTDALDGIAKSNPANFLAELLILLHISSLTTNPQAAKNDQAAWSSIQEKP